MGLDQYAYVAAQANSEWNGNNHRELAYWRKHPNLQGWMEQLWRSRNTDPAVDPGFNGVEVELTWEDIDALEAAIRHKQLPATSGFYGMITISSRRFMLTVPISTHFFPPSPRHTIMMPTHVYILWYLYSPENHEQFSL